MDVTLYFSHWIVCGAQLSEFVSPGEEVVGSVSLPDASSLLVGLVSVYV